MTDIEISAGKKLYTTFKYSRTPVLSAKCARAKASAARGIKMNRLGKTPEIRTKTLLSACHESHKLDFSLFADDTNILYTDKKLKSLESVVKLMKN